MIFITGSFLLPSWGTPMLFLPYTKQLLCHSGGDKLI